MPSSLLYQFSDEIGIKALKASPIDVKVLIGQRFVRFLAYGSTTLILALYLSILGFSDERIGLFMTLTLLGDVVISLVLTIIADGIGRRKMLAFGALMMSASGVVFALSSNYWVLVLASVVGVISPSGNEIGPFRAIEESTIVHLVPKSDRTYVLAWYTVFGSAGASVGLGCCGWVVQQLQTTYKWDPLASYRTIFWAYAVLGLVKFSFCMLLSSKAEQTEKLTPKPIQDPDETRPLLANGQDERHTTPVPEPDGKKLSFLRSLVPPLSHESAMLVFKLCLLFGIDSLASGLVPASWMTYFFNRKFKISEGSLGTIFFVTTILSSVSNLFAASIARRIGLIKTMVFTHIPASIALALIPIPNNVVIAIGLLSLRASTNSLDQAPRQAFIAAAVLPEERTAVMGLVNVVKTFSQSAGPAVTGTLAGRSQFWVAFIVAGVMKLGYDVLMLAMFWSYRTVEERAESHMDAENDEVESDTDTVT